MIGCVEISSRTVSLPLRKKGLDMPDGYPGTSSPKLVVNRREMLALSGAGILSLLIPGCGGGGSGEPDPNSSRVVLKPNVVVLPSDGSVALSGVTDSSVTLSGAAPVLLPGAILVSSSGAGMLRRVLSAASNAGMQVLQTEDASL